MPTISRRSFVAGLSASLLPAGRAQAATPKVVVVGAGLAGLAAAYDLQQAGIPATVIEQADRVGGRVKTVRGHFADDAWVDLGGQTSGAFYANFFYYSQLFGLEFEAQQEFRQRPDFLMHLQSQLYSGKDFASGKAEWPVDLHDHEKKLAPFRLLGHYLDPIAKQVGNVASVLKPEFAIYDELNLRELLQQRGASDAAIAMIDHTLNYNSVDTVSALSALRDRVRLLHMQGGQAINLKHGNASLPEAFAKQLGDQVQLSSTLVAIERSDSGATLHVETKRGRRTLYADYVVLSLPFTALRNIQVTPDWPVKKKTIIDELPYTQIVQAWLQTRTRFWEKDGPVSMLISDGPMERMFNGSRPMRGERGLLINWVNGTGSKKIPAHDAEQHIAMLKTGLERIWPGASRQIETTLTNNWGDSYARGAYAHYAPGQMTRYAEEIPQPVGQIHFAGEHTELVAPGMEGALTSGKRVASEILAAVG